MNILAIRLARLGDVILLLPALNHLKQSLPSARVTLLTGQLCAPVAELCPAIDEVIAIDRIAMRDGSRLAAIADMLKLARDIRRRRFDVAIDFHGFRETNVLTWLSRAPRRIGIQRAHGSFLSFCFTEPSIREDKNLHAAAMFKRAAERLSATQWRVRPTLGGSSRSESELLVIPQEVHDWVQQSIPARSVAFYVDAPVPERVWPPERFAALADHIVERWNLDILVLSGVGGEALVQRVISACRFPGRMHPFSRLSLSQLTGLIGSSRLLISNDTGPMHMGPALAIPTIGLFSVGLPEHFRPTGPTDRFISGNPIERIKTEEVIRAIEDMRVIPDPDFRYLSSENEET